MHDIGPIGPIGLATSAPLERQLAVVALSPPLRNERRSLLHLRCHHVAARRSRARPVQLEGSRQDL